ncbi:MAG: endonuclease domain-containing protein [Vulcanimicrobiota bacterium]
MSVMQSKLRFESENYYFQIYNLSLREEYKSPEKISIVIDSLDSLFNFKLIEILSYDDTGIPTKHYRYDFSKPLPPDVDADMTLMKCRYDHMFFERFLFSPGYKADDRAIFKTLSTFFITCSGIEIARFKVYESIRGDNPEIRRLQKKRKHGSQFSLPHQNAYGSKIEETLGEAMSKNNIVFQKQQEIYREGKLLTVLDFYIEHGRIAIYCDGFQYHYDKETVIKDRQQDRILQLLGYKVLRYTGSEIVGDIERCVSEIQQFIKKFE